MITDFFMETPANIIISGIIFSVEADGYLNLKNHLDTLYSLAGLTKDPADYIAEAELRLAEEIMVVLNEGKQNLSTIEVCGIISKMKEIRELNQL
jgi:hypothetical protein